MPCGDVVALVGPQLEVKLAHQPVLGGLAAPHHHLLQPCELLMFVRLSLDPEGRSAKTLYGGASARREESIAGVLSA